MYLPLLKLIMLFLLSLLFFHLKVPTQSLETLSSLASLSLDYNQIEVLHQAAFRGLVSLVRLSLYGNKIKTIHPKVFLDTGGNLTRINLGNNLLSSVSSKSFQNLTALKVRQKLLLFCFEKIKSQMFTFLWTLTCYVVAKVRN